MSDEDDEAPDDWSGLNLMDVVGRLSGRPQPPSDALAQLRALFAQDPGEPPTRIGLFGGDYARRMAAAAPDSAPTAAPIVPQSPTPDLTANAADGAGAAAPIVPQSPMPGATANADDAGAAPVQQGADEAPASVAPPAAPQAPASVAPRGGGLDAAGLPVDPRIGQVATDSQGAAQRYVGQDAGGTRVWTGTDTSEAAPTAAPTLGELVAMAPDHSFWRDLANGDLVWAGRDLVRGTSHAVDAVTGAGEGAQTQSADQPSSAQAAGADAATQVPQNGAGGRLGDLSMAYETGYRPGQEALAAAKVSTGQNDPRGGVSYGAYQLSSKQGQVQKFLQAEGKPWAGQFTGRNDPTAPNGAFQQAWQSAPPSFEAQRAYIERTHYDPVVRSVLNDTGLDVTTRSPAVQNVVWSMAVNHGRAAHLVSQAVDNLQGAIDPRDPGYDAALINELYNVRRAYVVQNHQPGLLRRYAGEQRDALAMLGN